MESLGDNESLTTTVLTMKTVMLMSLVRPARSADLAGLDLRYRSFTPEGVVFKPNNLSKQAGLLQISSTQLSQTMAGYAL